MSLVDELNRISRGEFVARVGAIYEHSPWVAERAFMVRPFRNIEHLHEAMQVAMLSALPEEKLALIRAHPELLGKLEAAELTAASRREQASAGLERCTPEEKARMRSLNAAYREKFGFPFIVAVKGMDWAGIIERMQQRLARTPDEEVATALAEIGRIARFRLEALA